MSKRAALDKWMPKWSEQFGDKPFMINPEKFRYRDVGRDWVFPFGKWKGETVEFVFEVDWQYLMWCAGQHILHYKNEVSRPLIHRHHHHRAHEYDWTYAAE